MEKNDKNMNSGITKIGDNILKINLDEFTRRNKKNPESIKIIEKIKYSIICIILLILTPFFVIYYEIEEMYNNKEIENLIPTILLCIGLFIFIILLL